MTRPRVLVLTTYYHPVLGGVETHARQLVGYLQSHGFPVQVITKRVARAHPARDRVDGAAIHRVGPIGERRGSGKWAVLPAIMTKLLTLRDTYDVMVCIDYRGIGIAAVIGSRLLGRPLIVQAGTDGVLAPPGANSGLPIENGAARAARAVPRLFYRRADHIVCIARSIEREAMAAGIPHARIHYLPHGVDLARFHPPGAGDRDAIRKTLGWPTGRAVVLFVGRLSREKGVLDLLEAWRVLGRGDALLALVGPDMPGHPWDAGAPARRFVVDHGLQDRVIVHGPADDTAPFYRAADLLAQPSHFEAFGISAIEAMASALPIVASDVGGLRDFLTDGRNAFLHPARDPRALATALQRGLDDAGERARLAATALADVAARFDERVVLDQYGQLIQSAAAER